MLSDVSKPSLHRHTRFRSAHLPDDRDVHVYLPPQYANDPTRRFPVLYLQDGQNLFDGRESYVKGEYWRVGEHADTLIQRQHLEPVIIVGIHHAGPRRIHEYTPTESRQLGGGHADHYGRLLVDELKPFVDATYRTRPDAASTGIGGSSLGGLVSLYLALKYSDVFTRVAVMSPSVWWDRRVILRNVRAASPKPPLRIWLDIGTAEGRKAVEDVRLLRNGLIAAGWRDGGDLAYREYEGARHSEQAWAARVGDVLAWLFPSEGSSAADGSARPAPAVLHRRRGSV
ncbi:MAG: alpha/beta hydrolase [Vicinamibacterales bacterium]